MKNYVPLALSVAALAAALWWASTALVGGDDDVTPAAAPLPPVSTSPESVPRPEPKPPPLVPERPPPILESRPAPPPIAPPPERIVPDTEPAFTEGETEIVSTGNRRRRREAVRAKRTLDGTLGWGQYGWQFLGGPGASAQATRSVRARAGRARIGSTQGQVDAVRASAPRGSYAGLQMEVPLHNREMEAFWIGRFEVTNHQYLQYLHHSARIIYNTSDFEPRNLVEIATALVQPAPLNLDIANITARQLYEANRGLLLSTFKDGVVVDTDGRVDEDGTWIRIRERTLPRGLRLEFYERPPPGTWPSDRYLDRDSDHPVRDLSLEEAIDYAMWTGRHIPTEFEWEYAARGPLGSPFPWGARATGFRQRVNGGHRLPRGERPRTVPSHQLAEGASWIGCFNMLGNVSEWTSSWLDLYPDVVAPSRLGRSLVVRGGSAADLDRGLVRPPFRGWSREDPEGPPRPRFRRRWTGFRTARYEELGRSRIPSMQYFVRRGGQVSPDAFVPHTYEAWVGVLVLNHDRFFDPEDPMIRPGVKTIACQPLRAATFRLRPSDPMLSVHADHSEFVVTANAPVVFGIFENDIKLVSTWQATPDGPGALDAPTRYVRSDCPPGVWLLGTLHSKMVLIRPDLRQVFYLSARGRLVDAVFSIRDRKPPKNPERDRSKVSLRFDAATGHIDLRLEVPLGPSGEPYTRVARLRMRADAFLRDVARVTRWQKGGLR